MYGEKGLQRNKNINMQTERESKRDTKREKEIMREMTNVEIEGELFMREQR